MKSIFVVLSLVPAIFAAPVLEKRGDAVPASIVGTASTQDAVVIGDFHAIAVNTTDQLIDAISDLPEVAYIEPNYKVTLSSVVTQANAPWGLARLSSRVEGPTAYKYDSTAGAGTFAYVIDTGIQLSHPEFEGRAKFGFSTLPETKDGHGHGTHVAGIIGSKTYGVAKKTNLIAVKVFDDAGKSSNSDIISGLQWSVNNGRANGRLKKSVANMSLTTPNSQAMKDAAKAATTAGLFIAAAAGNDQARVGTVSPANEPSVCTVGAVQRHDYQAWYSNYGGLLDVWAPGTSIPSTAPGSTTAYMTGTSQAAPHVAGLAAYLIALEGARDPVAMCKRIQQLSTKGAVTNAVDSVKMLVYNGIE